MLVVGSYVTVCPFGVRFGSFSGGDVSSKMVTAALSFECSFGFSSSVSFVRFFVSFLSELIVVYLRSVGTFLVFLFLY